MNIAFLASYNGSSAQAITDACLNGGLMASPVLLITNNPNAKALEWAENKGLKTAVLNNKTTATATELDIQIAKKLQEHNINMVCCSGYMKLIGAQTIAAIHGRILNVHPALLPQYGGEGMYGAHVHQAVKENGDTKTGCTIHLVNDKYDEGEILAQKIIDVAPEDSAANIEKNVKNLEPEFYIETIRKILNGDILID